MTNLIHLLSAKKLLVVAGLIAILSICLQLVPSRSSAEKVSDGVGRCVYDVTRSDGKVVTITLDLKYKAAHIPFLTPNHYDCDWYFKAHKYNVLTVIQGVVNKTKIDGTYTSLSGTLPCANANITYTLSYQQPNTSGNSGGGNNNGGGAPSGQAPNPNYQAFTLNPDIPAVEGPVKLKSLSANPPIGAKGYSCRIIWKDSFVSYDNDTYCTFIGPDISKSFAPTTTTELYFDSPAITRDTQYRLICREGIDGEPQTKEATCRLNISSTETN